MIIDVKLYKWTLQNLSCLRSVLQLCLLLHFSQKSTFSPCRVLKACGGEEQDNV